MNRDEFTELVYETFADEPDNVLANGIIEAADAYVEYEKAQLSQQCTTKDTISRTETVEHFRRVLGATAPITDYDEGYVDGVEFGISTVSTMPSAQPQSTTGQLNDGSRSTAQSTDLIDRQAAIDALMAAIDDVGILDGADIKVVFDNLPSVQPEPHEGRFERKRDGVFCSVCHYGWEFITGVPEEVEREYHYCPNCGADMRGEKDG